LDDPEEPLALSNLDPALPDVPLWNPMILILTFPALPLLIQKKPLDPEEPLSIANREGQ
jgi:hypothetical protein